MLKCAQCVCFVPPAKLTIDEINALKRQRSQSTNIDESQPLDEAPGTCHMNPPVVQLLPTPRGPMNLTLWPQVPGADVGCQAGLVKMATFEA
jgi:hypothetical protein